MVFFPFLLCVIALFYMSVNGKTVVGGNVYFLYQKCIKILPYKQLGSKGLYIFGLLCDHLYSPVCKFPNSLSIIQFFSQNVNQVYTKSIRERLVSAPVGAGLMQEAHGKTVSAEPKYIAKESETAKSHSL